MIWISQWLCPNRHCAIAIAWDDQETNPQEAESRGERVFQETPLKPWCGICGEGLHVEHGRTRFSTMEEALPHLRAIEKANLAARAILQSN